MTDYIDPIQAQAARTAEVIADAIAFQALKLATTADSIIDYEHGHAGQIVRRIVELTDALNVIRGDDLLVNTADVLNIAGKEGSFEVPRHPPPATEGQFGSDAWTLDEGGELFPRVLIELEAHDDAWYLDGTVWEALDFAAAVRTLALGILRRDLERNNRIADRAAATVDFDPDA